MKSKILPFLFGIALLIAAAPQTATAFSGGSGGGGNLGGGGTVETGTPLTCTYSIKVNGSLPTWTGTYTVTPGIPGYYTFDTIQVSLKAKPLALPDGTLLNVTLFTHDENTGVAFAPINGYSMVCSGKVGTSKGTLTVYYQSYNQVIDRRLDQVVVSAPDGTILAVCHG